ncbi:MAG: TIM barrel protein [Acinetobacter sp.]
MIKLAVNLSMIFNEVPLIERFALAHQHGFKYVEIQHPYTLSISELRDQLQQYDLRICLINVPTADLLEGGNGLACVPDKELEFHRALDQALEYAIALNIPRVNILAGRQPQDCELLECLNIYTKNLKFACQRLHENGIKPVFEMINGTDMPHFLIQNAAQAQDILDAVNHPALKMQFDCYHAAMMGEDVLETLQENISDIGHIQFADCPGRHEPNTGDIQFSKIFEWLKNSNYQGFVAAEYRPSQHSNDSFAWKAQFFDHTS